MKLKLDENGYIVAQDGKPVYVHDDGKEVAFDAPQAMQKISQLNGEAKGHREAKEAAEAKLKNFDGIEDPAKALEALKTVANLDAKKLIDAGESDKVIAEAQKVFDEKLAEATAQTEKLQNQLNAELIGGSFARSKIIADKLIIGSKMAEDSFSKYFKVTSDGLEAFDDHGNPIMSRENPGKKAGFEEALEQIINNYPDKDNILKGSQGSGAGASGQQGNPNSDKQITRQQFDNMDANERHKAMSDGVTITD